MESKGTWGKEKRVNQHGGVGDIHKYINNSGMARGSPVKYATLHMYDIPGGILQRRSAVSAIPLDKYLTGHGAGYMVRK